MSRRKRRGNWLDLYKNNYTFIQFYNRLLNIAITTIKWNGLPEEINELFMEHSIQTRGSAIFFKEDIAGVYAALNCTYSSPFNVYNVPMTREAYAIDGYRKHLTSKDSVLIWNNYLRTTVVPDLQYYAMKLFNIQRTIDINVNGQKTPLLILCDENQKLTMLNLYEKYEGGEPLIMGNNSKLNPEVIQSIKTDVPYISDKLYALMMSVWAEALTYLGVSCTPEMKKERMISGEMESTQGHLIANREARLATRRMAAKEIKNMFGLDLEPEFYQPALGVYAMEQGGVPVEGGEQDE